MRLPFLPEFLELHRTKDLSVNSLYYFAEWFMLRLFGNDEAAEHEAHGELGGIGCFLGAC
jgi:hypothetical protein